jgi:hypothetical protein
MWAGFLTSAAALLPALSDLRSGWAMPKPLLAVNLLMAGLSATLLIYIGRILLAPDPVPQAHYCQPRPSEAIPTTPPPERMMTLYGVVISDDSRVAYFEDPATKRVFGYRIGDRMAGGQVERIEPDRVVIKRAESSIEVVLPGPNKRRSVVSRSSSTDATDESSSRLPVSSASEVSRRGSRSRPE